MSFATPIVAYLIEAWDLLIFIRQICAFIVVLSGAMIMNLK
jgi:hypothetical protein